MARRCRWGARIRTDCSYSLLHAPHQQVDPARWCRGRYFRAQPALSFSPPRRNWLELAGLVKGITANDVSTGKRRSSHSGAVRHPHIVFSHEASILLGDWFTLARDTMAP